jgi:hypothetical protein
MKKVGVIISSQYVTSELQIDFGQIIPLELPLGNKFLFNYQTDFLRKYCEEIYVTIPDDYSSKLKIDNVIYLDKKLTLIEVIIKILEKFQNNYVYLLFGDTIIDVNFNFNQKSDDNLIFTSGNNEFNYNWSVNKDNQIIVGFIVFNKSQLTRQIARNSHNFNDFIDKIHTHAKYIDCSGWMDFGQKRTYSHNKIKFLEARGFNSISYSNGFVEKKSKDWFKMYAEYNWLKNANKISNNINTPFVKEFNSDGENASYKIEYKDFISLSDKFVFGRFNINDETKVITLLLEVIKHNSNYIVEDDFISKKLKERFSEISKDLIEKYSLQNIYNTTYMFFHKKKMEYGFFHGDICYSNILFNNVDNTYYLIDPRGYLDKSSGFSMIGPQNYDLYKIAHSYVCGYDRIIAFNEVFSYEIIKKRFDVFCEISDLDKVELKHGLIQLFISMIPLHYNNSIRQDSFARMVNILNNL